ncbi:MAG: MFS transporter [Betaproteobacteria bacterium]
MNSPATGAGRMPALLYFFALCNLIIASSAFVLGGILEPVSRALNVSLAATGQAMTAYALGAAVLAPMLILATGRWSRRTTILLALGLFTLGSLSSALAPTLGWLMVGRVIMGAGVMFTAAASATAVSLVAPAQRGQALAIANLGQSVSYAVGVPIGTWVGLQLGWRWPLWLAAGASLLVWLLATRLLPRNIQVKVATGSLRSAAAQGAVWRVWLRTLLMFTAIFGVFTYIGPVLQEIGELNANELTMVLALFGCGGVVGTLMGGWAADRLGVLPTLALQLSIVTLMLALLPLTRGHPVLLTLAMVIWSINSFGSMTPQQSRLISLAPAQAPMLMSLNSSMLYVGAALGAAAGGSLIGVVGMTRLPWVAVPFLGLALLSLWPDWRDEQRARVAPQEARP